MTAAPPRRTQKQRRDTTIAKLVDATINALIELGYHKTSVARICERAGVSQGGLFRHFPTRTDIVAAATDEICRRHLERFSALLCDPPSGEDVFDTLVHFFRASTRDPIAAAWRDVIAAARTDDKLREAIAPPVYRFEQAIMDAALGIPGAGAEDRDEIGTFLLSLLHMFDSEAMTVDIVANDTIERLRHEWTVDLLRQRLQR